MSNFKKSSIPRQASYNSLYDNPLTEIKHSRSSSEGHNDGNDGILLPLGTHITQNRSSSSQANYNACTDDTNVLHPLGTHISRNHQVNVSDDKENAEPNTKKSSATVDKENDVPKQAPVLKSRLKDNRVWKPSSLQLCMKMNEPDSTFEPKIWEPIDSGTTHSADIWDYSDSEAAPASSWSTLPNRSLLCRPLPVDIGRCTCVIMKEASPDGIRGGYLYTLYTNEGQGRQNRKLAVALHKRHSGRSEFTVAQKVKGLSCSSDESFVGTVTANLMGSKYHIWDQGRRLNSTTKHSKLLAAVTFTPTLTTWAGSYRSMKVCIPKHQSMQLKNTSQSQHINGLPRDWEEKLDKVHQLFSKVPHYNNISKQYELDFRDRGRAGQRIQSSVKNFQLTLEKNGKQTILQLGRVGKSKYVMDYRYPMTGYQAFCICLASMDSKLCCTI